MFLLDYSLFWLLPVFWVLVFLLHEFCHILSGGLGVFGTIYVDLRRVLPRMYAVSDRSRGWWFYLSGGFLSGLVFLFLAVYSHFVCARGFEQCFSVLGVLNFVYGFYEMLFLPRWGVGMRYDVGRFGLYVVVLVVMLLFWMIV